MMQLKWQSIAIPTQNTVWGKLPPTVISVTLTYVHLPADKISQTTCTDFAELIDQAYNVKNRTSYRVDI